MDMARLQTIIIIFLSIDHLLTIYCLEEQEEAKDLEKALKNTRFSSCFEGLGCLDTTEEWYHDVYRQHNLEPLDRHTIRTEFVLITKNDPASASCKLNFQTLTLRKDLMSAMNYQFNVGIIFLIHDFTSNADTGWIKHLAVALLNKKDLNANIVAVDWEAGGEPPLRQAVSNSRVVALEIRNFIEIVQHKDKFGCGRKRKQTTIKIHVIGHGVGAHIAGYVGSYFFLDRITGLDPTAPYFEYMPPIVRLDPCDAKYVEVLHTDSFNHRSQGTKQAFGHSDFYLNGAKVQPDCNQSTKFPIITALDRNTLPEGVILPGCSHKRAFKYYIESIENDECEFTGFNCESYADFQDGRCASCGNGSRCAIFGLSEPESYDFAKFYLNTRGQPPFCINAYKVDVYVDKEKTKSSPKGIFEIIMLDENGVMVTAVSSSRSSHTFEAGHRNTGLYYAPSPRITKIIEARLKWIHNPNSLCVVFCTTSINVKQIVVNLVTSSKWSNYQLNHLCPKNGQSEIETNSYAVLIPCSDAVISNLTCSHHRNETHDNLA